MKPINHIFSMLLVAILVAGNISCACASSSDENNQHTHHTSDTQPTSSIDCEHQDCSDCLSVTSAIVNDRPTKTLDVEKPSSAKDLHVGFDAPARYYGQTFPRYQSASSDLFVRAATPVQRHDLLLE